MKCTKKSLNKGSITIEASLVFVIFFIAYILINNIGVSIMSESLTRKALFETGEEIKSYIQILDKLDMSTNLSTKKFDKNEYKDIIFDSIKELDSKDSYIDLLKELKDLMIIDTKSLVKKKAYQEVIKNIFINKLYDIKNINDIKFLGIVDGANGFDFSNTKVLENPGVISLVMSYDIKLDKFGIFSFKYNVNQSFDYMVNLYGKEFNNKDKFSIWKETNFTRGRYFANYIRENYGAQSIETGSGIDLYDKDKNIIYQTFSINIFEKSYTNHVNDEYIINEGFIKTLEKYKKDMTENVIKTNNKVTTESGEVISFSNPKEKIIIVLPEEAKKLTNIEEYKSFINEKIGDFEFIYLEKVFDVN